MIREQREDPSVDVANDIVELFEAEETERYQDERRARLGLLDLHAVRGIIVGLAIIIGGAPNLIETNFGLISRPLFGWLPLIAGSLVIFGQRLYASSLPERIGLVLLGLWDITFGLALAWVILGYDGDWVLCAPWTLQELPEDQPRLYPPLIYLVLCAMLWGPHLRALLGDKRERRPRARRSSGERR
jgi:hypothetical protein